MELLTQLMIIYIIAVLLDILFFPLSDLLFGVLHFQKIVRNALKIWKVQPWHLDLGL